jgi:transposase
MEKKNRPRKYDDQFKQEALRQVANGQSVASVARSLGIGEALLYQWRHR